MGGIIIVEGCLASGKSTFALALSKKINVPCLIKDLFKSAMCRSVPITNREESILYSAVTFDAMMFVTERLLETGSPLIIEGNFAPPGVKKIDESGVIKAVIEKYNCRSLTFKFTGDTKVLHKRFIDRENTPQRGQANRMFKEPVYEEFDLWCKDLAPFNAGGEIITVDTTDIKAVDFNRHFKIARDFLSERKGVV